MSRIRDQLGPPWPPPLDAYNYLCGLTKPDWAWECLRRNLDYRAQVLSASLVGVVSQPLDSGALLTRMPERVIPAEAWALCCFR
jgi:Proteobacterial transcriptional regulator-like domain